jgi:hypothetical protein
MRREDSARFPPSTLRSDFDQSTEVDYNASPLYTQLEGVAEWWELPQFRAGAARDPPLVVDPAAGLGETFAMRITDGNDDGEEYYLNGGNIYTDSSDLELGLEGDKALQAQWVYTRFSAVAVPQGVRVLRAYLTFVVDENDDEPASLTIYGEAIPNSPPIDRSIAYHVSSRQRTTSSVPWSDIPPWSVDEVHDSPDLAAIVQELLDNPAWAEGNAMTFLAVGVGERTVESVEGELQSAPVLTIEYVRTTELSVSLGAATEADFGTGGGDVRGGGAQQSVRVRPHTPAYHRPHRHNPS